MPDAAPSDPIPPEARERYRKRSRIQRWCRLVMAAALVLLLLGTAWVVFFVHNGRSDGIWGWFFLTGTVGLLAGFAVLAAYSRCPLCNCRLLPRQMPTTRLYCIRCGRKVPNDFKER